METITFEKLIEKVKSYNAEEVEVVTKAYEFANELHKGQKRQSGEDYISHPIAVAYILAEMHADRDTLCAALLHDTIEDTPVTKIDIAQKFNKDVANLVDGVSKISKLNFSSKSDEVVANTRKILTGLTEDARIIIIKLADRLHNMRTLEHKSEFKQKENALETMEIFVPLAYYLGAYALKNELEDLSFKYLKPETYHEIEKKVSHIKEDSFKCLSDMLSDIDQILNDSNIPHEIKVRTKNIYGIYKKLLQNHKINDIHDLLAIKVMVDDIKDCYITLGLVHSKFHPINRKFKDYISTPKTNMYKSLHTTVFGPEERLVQIQIRTLDMEKIDSFGLTAYWDSNKGEARSVMQNDLKEKFQFFKSLSDINKMTNDNKDFVSQVKGELFTNNVYVYTTKGEIVELPLGSTPIDFAYKISDELGNTMIAAFVNEQCVDFEYELKNKDRIRIIADEKSYGPRNEWFDKARTTYAKRKIKEFLK